MITSPTPHLEGAVLPPPPSPSPADTNTLTYAQDRKLRGRRAADAVLTIRALDTFASVTKSDSLRRQFDDARAQVRTLLNSLLATPADPGGSVGDALTELTRWKPRNVRTKIPVGLEAEEIDRCVSAVTGVVQALARGTLDLEAVNTLGTPSSAASDTDVPDGICSLKRWTIL